MNPTTRRPLVAEALQARFALRVVAGLAEAARDTPADVTERLRFARTQALERARAARPAAVAVGGSTLALPPPSDGSWWLKLAALLPLALLVAGLFGIGDLYDRSESRTAAQIDADLLADDLPPAAYRDPGFVEFLKSPQRD